MISLCKSRAYKEAKNLRSVKFRAIHAFFMRIQDGGGNLKISKIQAHKTDQNNRLERGKKRNKPVMGAGDLKKLGNCTEKN